MAKHDWVRSTLGHGNTICSRCKITDLEAAALGEQETCSVPPAADSLTIWKATLNLTTFQDIEVPEGAVFLSVEEQHIEDVTIWFLCDPKKPKVKAGIWIAGTGHPAPAPHLAKFIGTVIWRRKNLVWHVFHMLES